MASYPNTIYSPRTRENRSGVVYDDTKKTIWFKEDADAIEAEIVALETELEAAKTREYADNDAAKGAGLTDGQLYRTGDVLKIVHS